MSKFIFMFYVMMIMIMIIMMIIMMMMQDLVAFFGGICGLCLGFR